MEHIHEVQLWEVSGHLCDACLNIHGEVTNAPLRIVIVGTEFNQNLCPAHMLLCIKWLREEVGSFIPAGGVN